MPKQESLEDLIALEAKQQQTLANTRERIKQAQEREEKKVKDELIKAVVDYFSATKNITNLKEITDLLRSQVKGDSSGTVVSVEGTGQQGF